MPKSTITNIATKATLARFEAELLALNLEQLNLVEIEQHKQHSEDQQAANNYTNNYKNELITEIQEIESRIQHYKKVTEIKAKPRQKRETTASNVIDFGLGLGWSTLLGVGIILQETVKVTAAVLGAFLFPLHFVFDGIRSIWSLYQTARDSDAAQRKTLLGANIVHILGLIAAATVTVLAVTNPFALPVIFVGLTGAGLYNNAYVLHQTSKSIKVAEDTLAEVQTQIKTLKDLSKDDKEIQFKISRLNAKESRLKEQLTHLQAKRFELRRELVLNSLGMVSVSLLLASAVLTIVFPPAAVALATVSMLLFASIAIVGALTSPPVRNAVKQLWKGIKNLFGASTEDIAEENAPLLGNQAAANDEQHVTGNASTAAPSIVQVASMDKESEAVITKRVRVSSISSSSSFFSITSKSSNFCSLSNSPTEMNMNQEETESRNEARSSSAIS